MQLRLDGISMGILVSKWVLKHIPLREGLITSNVSSLACFAAVTGFGVALAWWTAAWTDHFGVFKTAER